jgi:hypothetical protein
MKRRDILMCLNFLATFSVGCDGLYSPQPQTTPSVIKTSQSSAGTIFPVNISKQICNPSIGKSGPYTGCMLWLNFGGDLNVTVPSSMSGYRIDRAHVIQHDRLSISDTTNTIRWFMMRDQLGISYQIQDPEWSTHPDYIVCLGGNSAADRGWSGYAVRISDKSYCKLNQNNLQETSSPHVWLPAAASGGNGVTNPHYDPANGMCDVNTVRAFFGTDSVKLVYAKGNPLSLFYVDFHTGTMPVPLAKPAGRETWATESPLISPDGNWIVYNCFTIGLFEVYVQQLKANSAPILVAKDAIEPHWWVHPEFPRTYIVYSQIPAGAGYYIKEDYGDPTFTESGSLGATYKQEISIASGSFPAHASCELIGQPSLIVKLPFKGGISDDGKYLCTGYEQGYIISLF